ncbi:RNA polymerase factor sigma-32 [Candidatus Legionella polyplacis]|uniref:RNA polymerase sigma factor RpoH n=1 Tax=Candidatus Legionella polyplacis TaxID=2005262 RepID=UPI000C1E40C0|nr:RNA polymerase sigma factor RpoH [Candidatus Legionella polyplacis]ATW01857.1 RNA polymerase factor sigma-32 [Candidatus Legionella polyplacis]
MKQKLELTSLKFHCETYENYIHYISQIKILTVEEEYEYARRFKLTGDLQAARYLVLSHLRYVVRVARGYLGYGLPLNDLIQEGNIGLMKAVKRFNPKLGVRLVSFAVHWIKAEIHEFVLKNWRIVKVATTKAQRKLFFNLRQIKKRLGNWFSKEEIEMVANNLGVQKEDVVVMEQRLFRGNIDVSYDSTLPNIENEDHMKLFSLNYLFNISNNDPAYLIEKEVSNLKDKERLFLAIEKLDNRSKDILMKRWLTNDKKFTLNDLAKKYNVSAERIRQLEKNAMKKIRLYIEKNYF